MTMKHNEMNQQMTSDGWLWETKEFHTKNMLYKYSCKS